MLAMLVYLLYILIGTVTPTFVEKGTLTVEVQNIEQARGMLWLGIYRSEDEFLIKEKCILLGQTVTHPGNTLLRVPDLPYGEYAFAIFHDKNNNGTLDQNRLGIPAEPFAFSRHLSSRFRLPTFQEVKFQFRQQQMTIKAPLKKWWQAG